MKLFCVCSENLVCQPKQTLNQNNQNANIKTVTDTASRVVPQNHQIHIGNRLTVLHILGSRLNYRILMDALRGLIVGGYMSLPITWMLSVHASTKQPHPGQTRLLMPASILNIGSINFLQFLHLTDIRYPIKYS